MVVNKDPRILLPLTQALSGDGVQVGGAAAANHSAILLCSGLALGGLCRTCCLPDPGKSLVQVERDRTEAG